MIGAPSFPDLSALVVDESLYIRRIVRDNAAADRHPKDTGRG